MCGCGRGRGGGGGLVDHRSAVVPGDTRTHTPEMNPMYHYTAPWAVSRNCLRNGSTERPQEKHVVPRYCCTTVTHLSGESFLSLSPPLLPLLRLDSTPALSMGTPSILPSCGCTAPKYKFELDQARGVAWRRAATSRTVARFFVGCCFPSPSSRRPSRFSVLRGRG